MKALGQISLSFFACLGLLCSSCGHNAKPLVSESLKSIDYDPTGGGDLFNSDLIREIELVPLETSDSTLIGAMPECMVDPEGGYCVADINGSQRIMRYDSTGRFLFTIGERGKSSHEYLKLSNCVIDSITGDIFIFSDLDKKICRFSKDGRFINSQTAKLQFNQGFPAKDGNFWLWLGHGNGVSDYAVLKIDPQGETVLQFIPSQKNILPVEEMYPVFVETSDGRLLLRESFSNRICEVTDDGITPLYRFDFGKYNIPDEYFEKDSPMAAGDFLMKQEFVVLDRITDSPNYFFVQAMIQRPGISATMVYGLQDKRSDRWQWFNFRDAQNNTTPGFNSVRSLTGNDELICLVDPMRLMEMAPEERSIFRNPEVIGSLTEESNPVVLKCRLK